MLDASRPEIRAGDTGGDGRGFGKAITNRTSLRGSHHAPSLHPGRDLFRENAVLCFPSDLSATAPVTV